MADFTVVSFYTPKFGSFAPQLALDCRNHNYELHCEAIGHEFGSLIEAFDFKVAYIQKMVRRFQHVLWLDVECRIVRPIPVDWQSPLISTYAKDSSLGYSSGVLMLDEGQSETIRLWRKYAERYPRYPDDFVLEFLAREADFGFNTISLEFYDRTTACPVVRGDWMNESTIIQHPTTNRWPSPTVYRKTFSGRAYANRSKREAVSRQRKGIFYRNFGGDVSSVEAMMREGTGPEFCDHQWVFNAAEGLYAPQRYWPDLADDFMVKPRTWEKSRENFFKTPSRPSFRERAIAKMRLDRSDAQRFGRRASFVRNPSRSLRRFFFLSDDSTRHDNGDAVT